MNTLTKEELVRNYLPVVDIIVTQERKKLGISSEQALEEMKAYAMEGLAQAASKYDPSRKTVFSTYADMRVRGAIYDGLSQSGWFPRSLRRKINFYRKSREMIRSYSEEPPPNDQVEAVHRLAGKLNELATAYVTTYVADSEVEPASNPADADVIAERKEFRARIDACIERLPKPQGEVVKSYFFEEQGLSQIAHRMNISKSWTSRILSSALSTMKKSFGKEHIKDALESFAATR